MTNNSGKSNRSDGNISINKIYDIANIPIPHQWPMYCCRKHSNSKNSKHHCSDKHMSKYGNFYNSNKMNASVKYYTTKHQRLTKEIYQSMNHNHKQCFCKNSRDLEGHDFKETSCSDRLNKDNSNTSDSCSSIFKPNQEYKKHSHDDCTISVNEDYGKKCSSLPNSVLWSKDMCCDCINRDCSRCHSRHSHRKTNSSPSKELFSNKFVQIIVGILILIMAFWFVFVQSLKK